MPEVRSRRLVRFGMVGLANTLLDAGVFGLLVQVGAGLIAANLTGWAVGACLSFWANGRWTFRASATPPLLRFARFIVTGAVASLILPTCVLVGLSGLIGIWPAKLAAIASGATLGFVAARWSIEGAYRSARKT